MLSEAEIDEAKVLRRDKTRHDEFITSLQIY